MTRNYDKSDIPVESYASYFLYQKCDRDELPSEILLAFEQEPWVEEYDGCGRSREAFYRVNGHIIRVVDFERWCADCLNKHDWPIFMVWDHLWKKYGNGEGMLCPKCFSKRMGRPLTRADLNDALCNTIFVTDEDLAACGK